MNQPHSVPSPIIIALTFMGTFSLQIALSFAISSWPVPAAILLNQSLLMIAPLLLAYCGHIDLSRLLRLEKKATSVWVLAVFLMLFCSTLTEYLLHLTNYWLPVPAEVQSFQKKVLIDQTAAYFPIQIILLGFVPALCEEFFFRGFCQSAFLRHMSAGKALIISSLFFAVAHANIWYFHLFLILGLVLGFLYHLTKSLWIPIIAHGANNIWTLLLHRYNISLPPNENFGIMDIPLIISILGGALYILKTLRIKLKCQ